MKKYKAIVVHSGGMDSSICLGVAVKMHGEENVLSLGFNYNQRHNVELDRAQQIADFFKVNRVVLNIECLGEITENSLTNKDIPIKHEGEEPNSLVVGRNGLMARLASIHADHLGADEIYLGVIEVEEANSGYRDCSRDYMDRMQEIMRIDLNNTNFNILTPIVKMTKLETMVMAFDMGILKPLLEMTISCYEGTPNKGCGRCPACKLRNEGISEFLRLKPEFEFSYKNEF